MGGNIKDRWSVPSTAVAHEFIDVYMASANGEYVKVYLYVLRHQEGDITIEGIADALNHTESDVRRALAYWKKLGVLSSEPESQAVPAPERYEAARTASGSERHEAVRENPASGTYEAVRENPASGTYGTVHANPVSGTYGTAQAAPASGTYEAVYANPASGAYETVRTAPEKHETAQAVPVTEPEEESKPVREEPVYSAEQVNRLSQDEEFSQLLYIAQKYMNKVFTPRDCQVFAYLYENLEMNSELLEYLVEYCVQNGHTSVRYIEAVARNWHEKGIHTAQEAKDFSAAYNRDSFAVMKAFGLNSRKPAAPEQKLINKWFRDYGFSRELVLEACNRTITSIHNPSFEYADKILTEWKKAGIRTMADLKESDARRAASREENAQSREKRFQKYDSAVSSQGTRSRKAPNQFHNFEQRDTDYDALMLKQVKEWVGQQP